MPHYSISYKIFRIPGNHLDLKESIKKQILGCNVEFKNDKEGNSQYFWVIIDGDFTNDQEMKNIASKIIDYIRIFFITKLENSIIIRYHGHCVNGEISACLGFAYSTSIVDSSIFEKLKESDSLELLKIGKKISDDKSLNSLITDLERGLKFYGTEDNIVAMQQFGLVFDGAGDFIGCNGSESWKSKLEKVIKKLNLLEYENDIDEIIKARHVVIRDDISNCA